MDNIRVKEISEDNWSVEITPKDKERIACVVKEFGKAGYLPEHDIWKNLIKNPDDFWVKYIVGQFCVMGGVTLWEKLTNYNNWDTSESETFLKKMSLSELVKKDDAGKYIHDVFQEFKLMHLCPTRFWKRTAARIARFVKDPNVVMNGKLILFDELDGLNEDEKRSKLFRRTKGFFKLKSISDLMIELGMAENLIAFDTRIVGFLIDCLELHLDPDISDATEKKKRDELVAKVQSDETLYKSIEKELRRICEEIGVPLSSLDRILFRSIGKSEMEGVFK